MTKELVKQHTTSPLVGMQIITAAGELFNHVDVQGPMWYKDGDREVRLKIVFSNIFQKPPHIILGVTGLDSSMAQICDFHCWQRP